VIGRPSPFLVLLIVFLVPAVGIGVTAVFVKIGVKIGVKIVVKIGVTIGIVVALTVIALIVREVLQVPDEVVEGVTYVADVANGIDAKCTDAWSRRCCTES
jgi:hypothetical protein